MPQSILTVYAICLESWLCIRQLARCTVKAVANLRIARAPMPSLELGNVRGHLNRWHNAGLLSSRPKET